MLFIFLCGDFFLFVMFLSFCRFAEVLQMSFEHAQREGWGNTEGTYWFLKVFFSLDNCLLACFFLFFLLIFESALIL